jgi:hypothetical protein
MLDLDLPSPRYFLWADPIPLPIRRWRAENSTVTHCDATTALVARAKKRSEATRPGYPIAADVIKRAGMRLLRAVYIH